MAVDAGFGYAEYEYAKYLMDKSPEDAKIYFERAASHGSFQAEYTYGKMLFDEGNVKKRENGLNAPLGRMRGHRREWDYCFTTSTRITRQVKPSFPLQPRRATSLRMRRYVLSSRG